MSASDSRPAAVTTAFWLLVLGAVLLMSATLGFDTLRRSAPQTVTDETVRNYLRLYRGAGVLLALAGAALAAFAARARDGDTRFRRSATGLSLAIVILVSIAAGFGLRIHILSLFSLLPIIAGTLTLNRRAGPDV